MKTEEIWWTRLSNSVRFLEDARDALLSGRSVVMTFPDEVPWQDVMTDTLEQHLFPITDERSFEVHDVSESMMIRVCIFSIISAVRPNVQNTGLRPTEAMKSFSLPTTM